MMLNGFANIDVVEKNFSRHANMYDKYADIQYRSATELIKKLPAKKPQHILDLGCGTGNYTRLLRQKFKDADIKALDISRSMIDVARRKCPKALTEFIVADAEKFSPRDKFDLITSNAAFQWFDDLGSCLGNYKRALTRDGAIAFSMFGPLTFCELSRSVKDVLGEDAIISSDGFLGIDELTAIMKGHFKAHSVKDAVIKKKYGCLSDLLRHIKYTGTRGGNIRPRHLWTRTMLDEIEAAYISKFGQVEASYQIFYCQGAS